MLRMQSSAIMTRECEVCLREVSDEKTVVCAVPGVPFSACFCHDCLASNAIPYAYAVDNTWAMGGYENAGEAWREIIEATLTHLGISMEEFLKDIEVVEDE